MATPAFGEPSYDDPNAAGATGGGASGGASAAQAEALDINDPRLTSESLTDDTSQDAYAVPPPIADGKWRAKLKIVQIKNAAGQLADVGVFSHPNIQGGRLFLAVNVEASVIDITGKNDGVKLTEYWVKSLIDERKGTSQMTTIGTKAGGSFPSSGSTDKLRYEVFAKTLAGEPEVIIDTQWEASCQACQKKAEDAGERAPKRFLRGMRNFPQVKPGGANSPDAKCPVCGAQCRAQVRINGYLSVKEAKPTQGIA